jgi:hypothetical protein
MMGAVRSRGWLLLGAVVLVVALGTGAFGWATWTAKEYEKDFDRWASDVRPKANGSARVPVAAFGHWHPIEDQDLKDQADGCDEVRAGRPALAAATEKLPRLTELPVRWLSPEYDKAVDRDRRRAQVVKAFSDAANPVLRQMQRDCAFDGKVLRLDARRDTQWDKVDKLADPSSVCDYKDGCIPVDVARRQRFATASEKAVEHQRAVESLYRSKECASTSYGPACEDVADAMDRFLDREDEYNRQVRALTASSTGYAVNQAADRSERAYKKYRKTLRRVLPKQFPGVEDTNDFKVDPTSVDAYLSGVNNLRVRELLDVRNAMRGL